ncbi:MAG: hypothetical protein QNJ92_10360 [Alphaproteobacteria bacterium]|nr:hypothetical protein [Alphaproteobacteria bacterium]
MIIRTAFQSGANGGAVVIGRVLTKFPERPLNGCNDNRGEPVGDPAMGPAGSGRRPR